MKRWTAGFAGTFLTLTVLLGGCSEITASPETTSRGDEATKTSFQNMETSHSSTNSMQTFTFQVNADTPLYQCVATISNDDVERIIRIDITNAETGEAIQTIIPPENEVFTKSAVYFYDVTFQGNLALLIPLTNFSSYVTFNAYQWDTQTKQFAEMPSFQKIQNPCISTENKQILSSFSGNQITSYGVYTFQNHQFTQTNTLSWQPADLEVSQVSDAGDRMHLIEKKDDTIVKDVYVRRTDFYTIDAENPLTRAYFESGSFWDLNSSKWQCKFYDRIKK